MTDRGQRWNHARIEATLGDARELSASIADRTLRLEWQQLARIVGIPARRWKRHAPFDERPLVALVDGHRAVDVAAWERLASLAPGATALATRTAAEFDVSRAAMSPPDRRVRIVDLYLARRRRRRLRRLLSTLDADIARLDAAVEQSVSEALAPGDDDTPLSGLPTYALAARFERLLAAPATTPWMVAPVVDLLAPAAITRLVGLLTKRGREPGDALLEAARLQAGVGMPMPQHLLELTQISMSDGESRTRRLDAWLESSAGWHAFRDQLVEATPLRDLGTQVLALAPTVELPPTSPIADVQLDAELGHAITHMRRMTRVGIIVAQARATHVAGLRALTHVLADQLAADDAIEDRDDAFDLTVDELVIGARGGTLPTEATRAGRRPEPDSGHVAVLGTTSLRGVPVCNGTASGRIVALPHGRSGIELDLGLDDLDGAILACRAFDPGWLPLLMRCDALVTEHGTPLSFGAIAARELGIPAMVATRNLIAATRSASTAAIDAAAGSITIGSAEP